MADTNHKDDLVYRGYPIELKIVEGYHDIFRSWYCSYVVLEDSKSIPDEFLFYPTYRDGDEIGFDTAHYRNLKMSIEEKKQDAIKQAQRGIDAYLVAKRLNEK